MRSLVLLVGAAAVGAVLGYLLGDSGTGERAPTRSATAPGDTADVGSSTERPPEEPQPDAAPAERLYTQLELNHQVREAVKPLQEKLWQAQAESQGLRADLERMQTALPKPEILQQLEATPTDELIQAGDEIRRIVGARLLAVPEPVRERYNWLLAQPGTGAARVLQRGRYDRFVEQRGGGAYWSFKTATNDYGEEPDLEWQHKFFSTGFYGGNFGFFLDLGDFPIGDVGTDEAHVPSGLDAKQQEVWRLLWTPRPSDDREGASALKEKARKLKLREDVPATQGHTYLLRSVLVDEHDLLVAFRAEEQDEHGFTIVYRILHEWEMAGGR